MLASYILTICFSELNVFMDVAFLQAWKWDPTSILSSSRPSPLYRSLAKILSRSYNLCALRIRIAEVSGSHSAWRQFGLTRALEISFSSQFQSALTSFAPFGLPRLETLELDGFQDVEALLRLSPNLEILRMRLSAGFSKSANYVSRKSNCFSPVQNI